MIFLGRALLLLYQNPTSDRHEPGEMPCFGFSRRDLLDRLEGPNTLLNLSYAIHPPFMLQFEHRIFWDQLSYGRLSTNRSLVSRVLIFPRNGAQLRPARIKGVVRGFRNKWECRGSRLNMVQTGGDISVGSKRRRKV